MEVNLWNDKREREMYDNFADLYAIIKVTEKLEKAYVRDIISSAAYEPECLKLVAQFKTLTSTLKDTVPSVERFVDTYKMDCPAALNRLIASGVPATVEHRAAAAASSTTSASIVAECVQNFITAMDSLKLNMVAIDQLENWLLYILLKLEDFRIGCTFRGQSPAMVDLEGALMDVDKLILVMPGGPRLVVPFSPPLPVHIRDQTELIQVLEIRQPVVSLDKKIKDCGEAAPYARR
ncbi:hypothetical protein NE237_001054 [Protea cynaroides]|uniref:VPS28 N-terminal domain-containing protein n=1 Tax=Protea cynaroides TaxID=273540 RepID=A0A9Q0KSA7_9MAGN|nr:hypothetical protein NE237_001054 [Protea cynaroides]